MMMQPIDFTNYKTKSKMIKSDKALIWKDGTMTYLDKVGQPHTVELGHTCYLNGMPTPTDLLTKGKPITYLGEFPSPKGQGMVHAFKN